jgi:hypothetical protein
VCGSTDSTTVKGTINVNNADHTALTAQSGIFLVSEC